MNTHVQDNHDYGFVVGLFTGVLVGAGLALWFAPRVAAELRQRAIDAARNVADTASDKYRQASARVGEAVDELTRKGEDVRDDVADAVVHGAQVVEHYATAAKTGRVAQIKKHSDV